MSALRLLRAYLHRHKSPSHYRQMQALLAQITLRDLKRHGLDLRDLTILELASGKGGYSPTFSAQSGKFVASDIVVPSDSRTALTRVPFVRFDVLAPFPFGNDTFDLIVCMSLVEHIPDPTTLLREVRRVLRPDGYFFLTFPPWWSLSMVGGHRFKPFHFLGEALAVAVYNKRHGTTIRRYATADGRRQGLFPLTIRQVRQILAREGFEISYAFPRLSPVNTLRFPGLLADLLTWQACFLCRPRTAARQP